MEMIELLAPAGSFEAAVAAVQNGANAIYFGYGAFHARRNAKNFTEDEVARIVSYCRVRNVKTHVTLNTLLTDRELVDVKKTVFYLNRIGVDAVIVADLGLAHMIAKIAPQLAIHASTQMTVHNLEGVQFAAQHGFSRVVLSRELSREQIAYICKNSPVEIEVFAHGALCMCYSGQCYMSGIIGKRSGNRGLCAQPCRLPYRVNGQKKESYPLSLKDLCLADKLSDLRHIGIASLKIEGRMKRPEYVAVVTGIYSRLLRENREPTPEELQILRDVFSREGFTNGYYLGKQGAEMFGTRSECHDSRLNEIYKAAKRSYSGETPLISVRFDCDISQKMPSVLRIEDEDGHACLVEGPVAEPAIHRPIDAETIHEKLTKTGGTPVFCRETNIRLDEGITLPISAINGMRRDCIETLLEIRAQAPARDEGLFDAGKTLKNTNASPTTTISVLHIGQISDEMIAMKPKFIYLPIEEAALHIDVIQKYTDSANFCIVLPRIIWNDEWHEIRTMLDKVLQAGVRDVLITNIGQINIACKYPLHMHGDFGLNVFNSQTLGVLKNGGFISATLSTELSYPQIRDISKDIQTELIVYGRLPLMITENCLVSVSAGCCSGKINELKDRVGATFPVVCERRHRNTIYNSQVLYLADKRNDFMNLGLSSVRLAFTDESAADCIKIMKQYQGVVNEIPRSYTRGLYYRGVE